MDERIKTFLDALRRGLSGFPESETREAMEYYEEYISDALDEGEGIETLLARLGSPERISAVIMAESSIRKAQSSPGLKNYSKVLKYSRLLITRPFSILLFSIFISVTYSMAFLLFLGALASAAAACVLLPGIIYEAFKIPVQYMAELLGTIGIGVFAAALCFLLSYGLFLLCRLFIRLSAGIVGRILNKSGKQSHRTDGEAEPATGGTKPKKGSYKWIPGVCAIAMAVGLVLSLATGLPVKMFMIFNSMKPASIASQEWEFEKADVRHISISTIQSHIRVERGNSDKIRLTYEQPDWMKTDVSCKDGALLFDETSNGRLPFFSLATMHENRTDLVLTLPAGYDPDDLNLVSKGGFVHIGISTEKVQAFTYTGSIYVSADSAKSSSISASTATGVIESGGKSIGMRNGDVLEYSSKSGSRNEIKIKTTRGSIYID